MELSGVLNYMQSKAVKNLICSDDAKEILIESMALKLLQVWFIGKAQKRTKSVLSTT